MRYRYVTADVFTEHAYQGNPLAVVLEAEGDLATAGTPVRVQGWGHHDPVQLASQES